MAAVSSSGRVPANTSKPGTRAAVSASSSDADVSSNQCKSSATSSKGVLRAILDAMPTTSVRRLAARAWLVICRVTSLAGN